MLRLRSVLISLSLAALVAVPAQAGKPAGSSAEDSIYYLFSADPLGYPTGTVVARFEYRSGDRVLGSDEVLFHFREAAALVVAIPPVPWMASQHPVPDLRILVFADDLLLNVFDRDSLIAYNQVLRYTNAERIPSRSSAANGSPRAGLEARKIQCNSPCGGGCLPSQDYDCDGVSNANDNCTDDPNWNQSDCDGDGYGDVCDGLDGVFQPTGAVKTCMTDKDDHVVYKTFEHHVEQRLVDVTSCGSPDRWNRWIRSHAYCYGLDDQFCCEGIGTSIQQVGDSLTLWCGSSHRNIDFCH